jgi:DNA-binding XRE family transcriptional regulator
VSDEPDNRQALAGLRGRLADLHPGFADALRDEDHVQAACQQLRANLADLRRARGLDQADAAALLEVDEAAIVRLETGRGDIGLMMLLRYAQALGSSIDLSLRPIAS